MTNFAITNHIDNVITLEIYGRKKTFDYSLRKDSLALIRQSSDRADEVPFGVYKLICENHSDLDKILEFTYFLNDMNTMNIMGVYLSTGFIYINKPILKFASTGSIRGKNILYSCSDIKFPIKLEQGQKFSLRLNFEKSTGPFQHESNIGVFISDTLGNLYQSDYISVRTLL